MWYDRYLGSQINFILLTLMSNFYRLQMYRLLFNAVDIKNLTLESGNKIKNKLRFLLLATYQKQNWNFTYNLSGLGGKLDFCSVCPGSFKPVLIPRIFCCGRKQKRLRNRQLIRYGLQGNILHAMLIFLFTLHAMLFYLNS